MKASPRAWAAAGCPAPRRRCRKRIHRHRHVGVFLPVIALDGRGLQPRLFEKEIQQQAGAGAPLAVDEVHPGAGQVFDGMEVFGVAGASIKPCCARSG